MFKRILGYLDRMTDPVAESEARVQRAVDALAAELDAFPALDSHETALERQEANRAREAATRETERSIRASIREANRARFRVECFERMLSAGTIQMHNSPEYVTEWIDRFFAILHPELSPVEPVAMPPLAFKDDGGEFYTFDRNEVDA